MPRVHGGNPGSTCDGHSNLILLAVSWSAACCCCMCASLHPCGLAARRRQHTHTCVTDQALGVCECHIGGRGAVTLVVGNDLNAVILPHTHATAARGSNSSRQDSRAALPQSVRAYHAAVQPLHMHFFSPSKQTAPMPAARHCAGCTDPLDVSIGASLECTSIQGANG